MCEFSISMLGCVAGCPISHEFWRWLHSKIVELNRNDSDIVWIRGVKSNSFFIALPNLFLAALC